MTMEEKRKVEENNSASISGFLTIVIDEELKTKV